MIRLLNVYYANIMFNKKLNIAVYVKDVLLILIIIVNGLIIVLEVRIIKAFAF